MVVPPDAVEGTLVTEGELEMAMRSNVWRVLSRLGQQAGFFPWPFWSDPLRPPTYLPGDVELSVLTRSGTAQLGLGRLDASLDGNHLDVSLSATEAAQVAESLSALPHLAIVPPADPTAVATLIWSPGQTEPMAICSDPSLATFASARYLMILPNQGRHDEIRFQEDGFGAILSRKTTKALVRNLRHGDEISLGDANSRRIRFVPR
jgi:hypothetical protein